MSVKANGNGRRPHGLAAALIQLVKLAEEDKPPDGATYLVHIQDDKVMRFSRVEHGELVPKGIVDLTP